MGILPTYFTSIRLATHSFGEYTNGRIIERRAIMDQKEIQEQVIENYKRDENMMILVFAQWCVNNDLNPETLYEKAYPDQINNPSLKQSIELVVPKEESEHIPDQTVIGVLSLFGNDDLAFVVSEEIEKRQKEEK